MRKMVSIPILLLVCISVITISTYSLNGAEKTPQKVIDLANNTFLKWGSDPILVKAVNAENAKKKNLDKIKEIDKVWQATPGLSDFMKKIKDSECSKHLRELQKSLPAIAEIFLMDNQGANVAMTDKTSDYWQGDEAKFIKSYNKGKGSLHIGELEFDESSQAYLIQVSLPIKDGAKVIGAITIGIDVDKVD